MRILLAEAHKPLARLLRRGLKEEGFIVDVACDGEEADHKALAGNFDIVILDLGLPRKNGFTLLREWRGRGMQCHVLILSNGGGLDDKVRCLDQGADDCLPKPFELQELLARVRALIRRSHNIKSPVMQVYDLLIDTVSRSVKRAGQEIQLTRREYALLELLAFNRGKVVTRSMIWEHFYDEFDQGTSNVVDVHICYLRNKIDKGRDPKLILTRWGKGYMLRGEEPAGKSIEPSDDELPQGMRV